MNVTAILLTLLLILELVEAEGIASCNLKTNTSISYNFEFSVPTQQKFICKLKMCRCTINGDRNDDTSTCTSNLILKDFKCDNITIENTSCSTPSSTTTSSTQCSDSTTTAADDSVEVKSSLGALVGLLTVLLTLAIIGWVCTCVILMKKRTANIDKTKTR